VPIGKVSQDCGTPAAAMPGRIGRKWASAATPEKPVAATARTVTTTYAMCMIRSGSGQLAIPTVRPTDSGRSSRWRMAWATSARETVSPPRTLRPYAVR
jgi:hypothetical protein